ncbi:hypothetical protein A2U01_0072390, partial [Trifolium medium]|nr:hypothetical protein [Trifolium medium]
MGDDNAKNQETGNAESPLKEQAIPEAIPEAEPMVEEIKDTEVNMPGSKDSEVPTVDPSTASKDKT